MTGYSLRAAIAAACDLTNPRLSEVDWDEVAAAFVRLRDAATLDRDRAARAPGDGLLDEHFVPWFKVRGDDSLDQGIMRRCLLCGRTSRIVSSTASPSEVAHEPTCEVLALRAALGGEGLLREARARFVAEHWRDWAMAQTGIERVMAHPLALVLAALDGESDPRGLGLNEDQDEAFAALAASPTTEPGAGGLDVAVQAFFDGRMRRAPAAEMLRLINGMAAALAASPTTENTP